MLSRNLIPLLIFTLACLPLGMVVGCGQTPTPEPETLAQPYADMLSGPGWGHAVDGIRSRVLVPQTPKRIGQQVPVVVVIQNIGSAQSPDGSADLAPKINLVVWRNKWYKSIFLPVHPPVAFRLEKGKEFCYAVDLAQVIDLDVPDNYIVSGGYDSSVAEFDSAWKGGRVTSPPYSRITILPSEDADYVPVIKKQLCRNHPMWESAWGKTVRGLRVKISIGSGTYEVGESIPIIVTIANLGAPDMRSGTAQLFPHLDLWLERAGWRKHVVVPLNIQNRLWIKKGKEFSHRLDLAKTVDLDVPGTYAVSAGHENGMVTDIGDWTGIVKSPMYHDLIIVTK